MDRLQRITELHKWEVIQPKLEIVSFAENECIKRHDVNHVAILCYSYRELQERRVYISFKLNIILYILSCEYEKFQQKFARSAQH